MNYKSAIEYLFSHLPMFHRIGAAAYKADLKNIQAMAEILHHPENKFKSIHIAGTNGKGSVSHMLASVFQEAGYKAGLFTSPHLKDFRERIRINGVMIGEAEVVQFLENNLASFEEIKPSFFEWTTALAFHYFSEQQVDIAIIETGLGGRLDSTNIIFPELSLITNISFDHQNLLGNTLDKIAFEKAGIIKENVPVVISETQKDIDVVFKNKAKDLHAPIKFADDTFSATLINRNDENQKLKIVKSGKIIFDELEVGLVGDYQLKNVCAVLQALECLENSFSILKIAIEEGMKNVRSNTGLKGRWQVLGHEPVIVADVAHNEAGIRLVIDQLKDMKYKNLHIVFGMANDKDISVVLSLLPKDASYYFCQANIPRALDADQLKQSAEKFLLKGNAIKSVQSALASARKNAEKDDLIFIGGSIFVVAEVL